MRNFSFAVAMTLVLALASSTRTQAAEIVVLAAAAVEVPFEAVVHAFAHDTGNKVAATFGSVGAIQSKLKAGARAFDEKVESLIVDSHDGANRIQDPHWCKGGQS